MCKVRFPNYSNWCRAEIKIIGSSVNGLVIEKYSTSYDPKSHKIKNLGIKRGQQSFYIDTYMESLVLVEGSYGVLERKGTSLLPNKWMKYSTSS